VKLFAGFLKKKALNTEIKKEKKRRNKKIKRNREIIIKK